MSKYYAFDKQTGKKVPVPSYVGDDIRHTMQNVHGFNACLKMLNDSKLLDIYYGSNNASKYFRSGFKMARKAAIKGIKDKAKELNR